MKGSQVLILVIAVLIAFMGIVSIYSSTYQKEGKIWQGVYKKQILWVLIGLFFFFLLSNLNYRVLWDLAYVLYFLALFFLLLVAILGAVRLGAQRWLKFFWFNFQPSEFAKLSVAIVLARYYSKKSEYEISSASSRLGILRGVVLPFLFVAIPMGLIIEQPDLGSAMMLLLLFMCVLYLSEIKMVYVIALILLMVLPLPLLWNFLHDYQKDRLLVFLNPNIDPLGAGYTVIQSKIAIGSGWLFGKGWLGGTQSQLHFLPESHTDFIFATFAEEWGFVGSAVLLALYFILIKEGFEIAQRTRDDFGRFLAFGISAMLGIQVFVNIAMNMGLAPVVGLPLPLMSYGGSSVLVTFIALGILVNIDKTRSVF